MKKTFLAIVIGIFWMVCPSVGQVTPSIPIADALSTNPPNCGPGTLAAGITETGAAEGCATYLAVEPILSKACFYDTNFTAPYNRITVTTGGVYVGWITAKESFAPIGIFTDTVNVTADRMIINVPACYHISFSLSVLATQNTTIFCCVFKNGVRPQEFPCAVHKTDLGVASIVNLSGVTEFHLVQGDYLDLRCTSGIGENSITIDLLQANFCVKQSQ